jgi:hypothetical protein
MASTLEYMRAWRAKNKERLREYQRAYRQQDPNGWYASNRTRLLNYKKKYGRDNEEYLYFATVQRRYGISREEYDALLVRQNGVCAICQNPQSRKGTKRLSVDHCHKTKKVRGLLCAKCNMAIGILADDDARCTRAAEYLSHANDR